MIFQQKLIHGTLIKRYKRFLAHVKLDDGTEIVAHCTNSGSMKSCLENGAEVYLSPVNDRKHLKTLMEVKLQGIRAVMLYIVQRSDVEIFAPAWNIDPAYSETLKTAMEAGVEVIPVKAKVLPELIELGEILPIEIKKKITGN